MKGSTTLRLPDDRLKVIRAIAGYENRSLSDIYTELTDEYIGRHKETLDLLGIPNFLKECKEGLTEIRAGDYRIVFALMPEIHTIAVVNIAPRGDVYT